MSEPSLVGIEVVLLGFGLASAFWLWSRPYSFRAHEATVAVAAGAWRWLRTDPPAVAVSGTLLVDDGDLFVRDPTGTLLLALQAGEVSRISDRLVGAIDGREATVYGWPRFNALGAAVRPWEIQVGDSRIKTRGWLDEVAAFAAILAACVGILALGIVGGSLGPIVLGTIAVAAMVGVAARPRRTRPRAPPA